MVEQALAVGCEQIVAGGGDGTISMVASLLVGTDVQLAILPLGHGERPRARVGNSD